MKATTWDQGKTARKSIVVIGVGLIICFLAARAGEGWTSILPPLIAVGMAVATQRILLSLVTAILFGGLLNTVPAAPLILQNYTGGLVKGAGFIGASVTDTFNLLVLAFVAPTLIMISLMVLSGGFSAIVKKLAKYGESKRSSRVVTVLLGIAIFFDDYANTMIVGSSMRPMNDRNRVSREKQAFLVDATAAPIAGVALVSTWIGYEVGLFSELVKTLSLETTGYGMFLDAIAFRFYCIFMLVFVVINAIWGRDFGPMLKAERRAAEGRGVSAPNARLLTSESYANSSSAPEAKPSVLTVVVPMALLFLSIFVGLWIDGAGPAKATGALSIFSLSVWQQVIMAAENTVHVLTFSALVGLTTAALSARFISGVSGATMWQAVKTGFKASLLPCAILICAWSLKGACDSLETGKFLGGILSDSVSATVFPFLLFLVAGLTAFSTGTSWGTMAILIPTAIPVAFMLDGNAYGLITIISLGAVLDGAIFGDHCSPISDTTIMSSISSSCDHVHHVRTQMPYATLVAVVAIGLGYVPAALGYHGLANYVAAGVLFAVVFLLFGRKPEADLVSDELRDSATTGATGAQA